jgi:hypothetical protein
VKPQLLLLHLTFTPRPLFTPAERTPGAHCTGGWVGPRTGPEREAKGKILCLCRGSNHGSPVVQSVARHYTDWATLAPFIRHDSVIISVSDSVHILKRTISITSPGYENARINTGWTQIIRAVSNINLTQTKRHTEMKHRELHRHCTIRETWRNSNYGNQERSCWNGSKMATQSRKRNEFAHGGFLRNFLRKHRWTVATNFVEWNSSTQNAFLC